MKSVSNLNIFNGKSGPRVRVHERKPKPLGPERNFILLKTLSIIVVSFMILSAIPVLSNADSNISSNSALGSSSRSGGDDDANNTSDDSSGSGSSDDDANNTSDDSSGSSSETGNMKDALDAITDAEEEIQRAENEIIEASDNGKDTSASEELLQMAKDKLSEARSAYDDGDYENAEELAEKSRNLAQDSRMKYIDKSLDELDDDDDHDGVDDDFEDEHERDVEINNDGREVEISSERRNGESKDEFDIEFQAYEKLEIKMEYRKESGSTETDMELEVKFRKLLEFEDANGNGVYDAGETIVSSYNLADADYDIIEYETVDTVDGEAEHILTGKTSDGIFKIVLHITGAFAELESGVISPSEVKIDIIINNYTFLGTDTLLALNLSVETHAETEVDEDTFDESKGLAENEEELEMTGEDVTAFFSWVKQASVDGEMKPVKTTIESNGEKTYIYFNYPQGKVINHDPKIGVPFLGGTDTESVNQAVSNIVPFILAAAIGAIIIILSVSWRRKKNGTIDK